jgi:hypothetical protein
LSRGNYARKGGNMSVKHELASWIETDVIAEHILGEMED